MKQKTTTTLKSAGNSPSLFTGSHRSTENDDRKKNTVSNHSFLQSERFPERRLSKAYLDEHAGYLDPNEDRPE
jgi:hypothetical protein